MFYLSPNPIVNMLHFSKKWSPLISRKWKLVLYVPRQASLMRFLMKCREDVLEFSREKNSWKNSPAMQEAHETQVWSLGWEDPLEEGMATHSNILVPWTEEPGGLQSTGLCRVGHNWSSWARTLSFIHLHIYLLQDWLMRLWRPRSPMTSCQRTGKPIV